MSPTTSRAIIALSGLLLLLGPALPLTAQGGLAGRWTGAIDVMGQKLDIVVTLAGDEGTLTGTIDIPQQGARGLPLTGVRAAGQSVHFELKAGPGIAIFDGERRGGRIEGSFEQGAMTGTFSIAPTALEPAAPPPPYGQEEVTVANGAINLAGTLTLPPGGGPHPAVVLLTGSGAQDRDEDVFGMKVFGLLSDHLTRAGIAVLRSDDRGVGGSTGTLSQSTSSDLADDALAQVRFLKGRKDIDGARIGLVGHSEGGLVAPMAATRSGDVAFVVLMSAPAVTGERILLAQNALVARASGVPEEHIRKNEALQRTMFAAVRSGEGWDAVRAEVEALTRESLERLPEAQRQAIGDIDGFARKNAEQQLAAVRNPWFRFFLDYDPAPALAKLAIPVLATFAERDTQVPADLNREAMEQAFAKGGHRDHTITVVPKANHLYQEAMTGAPTEYPTLKKEFVPGFAEMISKWIVDRKVAAR